MNDCMLLLLMVKYGVIQSIEENDDGCVRINKKTDI